MRSFLVSLVGVVDGLVECSVLDMGFDHCSGRFQGIDWRAYWTNLRWDLAEDSKVDYFRKRLGLELNSVLADAIFN
jgi:hypothetical protein